MPEMIYHHAIVHATNFGLPLIRPEAGAEILYSFAIIFCSLMIYFGTKELYELSSYKGLKYFRFAFLFLAFSYIFRLPLILANPSPTINFLIGTYISLAIFMYLSLMSIFYLIESVLWKNIKDSKKDRIVTISFNAIAILISIATIMFDNLLFYIGLNIILFISAGIAIYLSSRKTKKQKKNPLHRLYILLLVFLFLNIFNILVPVFLETIKLFLYLISLSVFFVILYRVLKKSGN